MQKKEIWINKKEDELRITEYLQELITILEQKAKTRDRQTGILK